MSQKYTVTIEPDHDVVVTWPAPNKHDPKGRDAAILRRDSSTAIALTTLLGEIEAGERS